MRSLKGIETVLVSSCVRSNVKRSLQNNNCQTPIGKRRLRKCTFYYLWYFWNWLGLAWLGFAWLAWLAWLKIQRKSLYENAKNREKVKNNLWFYCVFAQKCWKTIGFIVLCSKVLTNHWFYCSVAQECWKTSGCIVFSFQSVVFFVCFIVFSLTHVHKTLYNVANNHLLLANVAFLLKILVVF